ncbi:MAG TPA: hypothetical protein VFW87_03835 [Pirellulales bacterium]|nr:hypothetical protein [Pirellulales bacterium]
MNAIDTNIFAYAYDPADPSKQAKARQLLSDLVAKPSESGLLWQVAVEFLSFLRKAEGQGRLTAEEVKARFEEMLQLFSARSPTPLVRERNSTPYRALFLIALG